MLKDNHLFVFMSYLGAIYKQDVTCKRPKIQVYQSFVM